jgi:two-component system chemotaxis response regulator CheB
MIPRDIVVAGTSAGGVSALKKLLAELPADLPASVCITIHLFRSSDALLLDIFRQVSSLPVERAAEGMILEHGRVYFAPADCHLLFEQNRVRLGHGPRENLQRPSINAMFRSAAAAFGQRVAGVVLTGLLDDGAAGLWEIKRQGGVTIVQDPGEAEYPSMPQAAVQAFDVDYAVGLAEMPALLERLAAGEGIRRSTTVAEARSSLELLQTCPECGGAMQVERVGRTREYRCHVGHRYGAQTMLEAKRGLQERSLLSALAQTEELVELLIEQKGELGAPTGEAFERELAALRETMGALREMLETRSASTPAQRPDV